MKKTKKHLKINIAPFDCSIRRYEGGFEWTFKAPIKNDYNRHKIIVMKFERWWLATLVKDLKIVFREEIAELNRLADLMGFKESE